MGLCRQLYKLLIGFYDVANCDEPISLSERTWNDIENDLDKSKQGILDTDFECAFRLPSTQQTHRAVDWLGLVIYIFPSLVVQRLSTETGMEIMNMVKFTQLSQEWYLNENDLQEMDALLDNFCIFINSIINTNKIKKTFLTPNFHYLKHVTTIIRNMGCLRYHSTRAMERAIGDLKDDIRSTVKTGENGMNVLVDKAATAHLDRLYSLRQRILDNGENHSFAPGDDDIDGYILTDTDTTILGKATALDPDNITQNKRRYPIRPNILQQLVRLTIGRINNRTKITTCGAVSIKGERYGSKMISRGKRCLIRFDIPGETR
jgi:hypothetical protein